MDDPDLNLMIWKSKRECKVWSESFRNVRNTAQLRLIALDLLCQNEPQHFIMAASKFT